MREKYMLALANLINGAELGYKDISSIPQYKKDIEYYVDSLEDKNKKYKEVIDKAIEYIEKCLKQTPIENRTKTDDILDIEYEYILGILKEVE